MENPQKQLTPGEVELLELIFSYELPESPINLDEYRKLAESDEDIEFALNSMLEKCLAYTEDVAAMEKYAREHPGEYDGDREEVDRKRTITHNVTVSSIDIFARVLKSKSQDSSWLKWKPEDRFRYGLFAITLTLNRFRDELITRRILDRIEDINTTDIDFDLLKSSADAIEIKVIRYVEILSARLKDEESTEPDLDGDGVNDFEELEHIKRELGKPEEDILGAFHKIYMRRYESDHPGH